jgi:hypothetical protein
MQSLYTLRTSSPGPQRSVVRLVVGIFEVAVEVLGESWELNGEMVHRDHLSGRLSDLQPLLLAPGQTEGAVGVMEDEALLEHQVNLLLHTAELVDLLLSSSGLLLHLLEEAHLLGNLGLLLLLL